MLAEQQHNQANTTAFLAIGILQAILSPWAAWSDEEASLRAPVQINLAEAIIEPFWDPEISGFDDWQIDKGKEHGLRVWQNWGAVDFQWVDAPEEGAALCMRKDFNVSSVDYDTLMIKMTAPHGSRIVLTAQTDQGAVSKTFDAVKEGVPEYAMPLSGAKVIASLEIAVFATAPGQGAGWIDWIGLQNAPLLETYLRRWDYSGLDWKQHIRNDDADLDFAPSYGIFMTAEALDTLRAEHRAALEKDGESRFSRLAASAAGMDFEAGIHEFVGSGGRDRGRARDRDQAPLPGGTKLAEAGLVLRDRELLVAAARSALCLGVSHYWDGDFRPHFPGGPADTRAFRRSYTCEDIAIILDLAGEVFTPAGRHYLMRRLAEEGIGRINFVAWRHEYIHETNQLAFFNMGRMYAYLVLEREYPRVRPYADLALDDTVANLNGAILPDGGYAEGPNYFGAMARRNYKILKHYARARDIELASIVPASLRRTADFAEVIASTTAEDVIPIGDSETHLGYDTLEAMVELMPDSYWLTMLNEKLRRDGREEAAGTAPTRRPFLALPNMGLLASHRKIDGKELKLFIMGNAARADHAHEDKGGFVLEYAGETYAADFAITSYHDPGHQLLKHCQRHNMLVPIGVSERPAPPFRINVDVTPKGEGDTQRFHARIDASTGWRKYFRKWVRTWDSPSPDQLVIEDDFELVRGTGVAFYWQTTLPCRIDGQSVVISGDKGKVTLTVPPECTARVEELPATDGAPSNRITITKEATAGKLRIEVIIQALPG